MAIRRDSIYNRRLSMKRIARTDAEEWAAWFRALADPTRLQVLNAIAASGPALTIGELVARVDVGQSTVSHHVRLLVDAGYVLQEREGTTTRLSVDPDCLADLPAAARAILRRARRPRYAAMTSLSANSDEARLADLRGDGAGVVGHPLDGHADGVAGGAEDRERAPRVAVLGLADRAAVDEPDAAEVVHPRLVRVPEDQRLASSAAASRS